MPRMNYSTYHWAGQTAPSLTAVPDPFPGPDGMYVHTYIQSHNRAVLLLCPYIHEWHHGRLVGHENPLVVRSWGALRMDPLGGRLDRPGSSARPHLYQRQKGPFLRFEKLHSVQPILPSVVARWPPVI